MDQSQTRRRRRDGSSSNVQQRLCPHCGRSFKRSEHLERHVRTRPFYPNFLTCLSPASSLPYTTPPCLPIVLEGARPSTNFGLVDTKEKPYICHCGSAFSRRDLLTRHVRISHETNDGASKSPDAPISDEGQQPISEPATPSDPTPSRSNFPGDRIGVPPSQYLDSNHDLGMPAHGASSYHHQLSPRQDYYHQG